MILWKIKGVKIRINIVLMLLALIYAWMGFLAEILLVFSAVLLHEMAHAITAFTLGIKIAEIEIWPFGGQAVVDDFTALDPLREICLAFAGPFCSLALAAGIYYLGLFSLSGWRSLFININLYLGFFNLLPALPLDGGRILQAVLSVKFGYRKAVTWTAALGKILGIGMVGSSIYLILSQYWGVNILLVGIFLIWAAHREGKLMGYAFMRFLVRKKKELSTAGFLPSRQLVSTQSTAVKDVLATVSPGNYLIVLMVDSEYRIIGMRSESELIDLLLEKGPHAKLNDSK